MVKHAIYSFKETYCRQYHVAKYISRYLLTVDAKFHNSYNDGVKFSHFIIYILHDIIETLLSVYIQYT